MLFLLCIMRRIILFALTVFICSCGGNTGTKQIGADNKTKKIPIVSRPDSIITKVSEIASDIKYFSEVFVRKEVIVEQRS